MSKSILAAALLMILGFTACKQEEVDPTIPGHYVPKGSIKYQNSTADLYDIYLDDAKYGQLYGGASTIYPDIPIGIHRVKAIQKEHIVGTAVISQRQINVYKDSVVEYIFP
jgi:hypothetical protein